MALSALVVAVAAGPALAAGAPEAGYGCTIESRHNTSINEPLPVEKPELFIPLAELQQDGTALTKRETIHDGSNEFDVTHRIDSSTGEYGATTLLTDHKYGEQYVIEEKGTCTRSAAE